MTQTLIDQLDGSKLTPRYWATFSLIVLQLICEIFDFIIVGFLVSAVAPEWGLTGGQMTVIFLAAGLGAMVGSLAFGWVADRHGRKAAVVGGGFVYCLGAGAVALIPEGAWLAFAALRFLVGVGYGGAGSSQFALVAEYTPTRLRTVMTSSLGIPVSIGVVGASAAVAALYPTLGWRGLAAVGAAPILVAIAIAFVAPESPRWLIAKGHTERARRALATMLGRPVEGDIAPAPPPPPVRSFSELMADQRRFWLIVLIQVGMGTALSGVLLWGPSIVAQLFRVSPQEAAKLFLWVTLAGFIGRIAFAFLPLRIGRVKSGLLIGYAGAAFLALAALGHEVYLGAIPLFILFLMLGMFFFDGGFSNINPYAVEVYPVRSAALGAGLAASAGGIGKMVGPAVLGLIVGAGNLLTPRATAEAVTPAFLFLAGACLLAGLAYQFLGVETHGKRLEIS